ncbi:MAG: GDP-L-fucose synthase, partial [Alphaproteobacteria bacterium]|nr:GDP-L-fucose synthase [Alphaproteobacteria bacterium]
MREPTTAPTAPVIFPLAGKRVLVAGHRGMVGSALVRRLGNAGCTVLTAGRGDADMRRQDAVEALMRKLKPEVVFVTAATVGGILANSTRPAEFLYDNLMIAGNLIEAAHQNGVKKLLFLGSSCIYPRLAKQPMVEAELLAGPLEPTNQWYAVAKIAGLKLCAAYRRQWQCDFISAQPTNLYGPGDRYDLEGSHVIPALIMKIDRAKRENASTVDIWGSGRPRREFLHVDDLADAMVFLMERYSDESHVNVGWGEDLTIAELAHAIAHVVGYKGTFRFDTSKPDGTPRKLLDTGKLDALGWRPRIRLNEGLADAYRWYRE